MEGAIGRDLRVIQQDLDALSADIAKLGNVPDEQSIEAANSRIIRIRADMKKVALGLGSESPIIEMADKAIEPAEDFLGERPIATIGLGFGLGSGVGFLLWKR